MADAIKIIKDDHRKVEALFKKYKDLGDTAYATKQAIAMEICGLLTLHAQMEEEFLYPRIKEAFNKEDDKMVAEAYAEHDVAKQLIAEIQSLTPEDEQFDAKVVVLCENITHHVKEEEAELLPKTEKKLSEEELDEIGTQMEDFQNNA